MSAMSAAIVCADGRVEEPDGVGPRGGRSGSRGAYDGADRTDRLGSAADYLLAQAELRALAAACARVEPGRIGFLWTDGGAKSLVRVWAEPLTEPDGGRPMARVLIEPAHPGPYGLTLRELDVLTLLVAGLTNNEIARRLFTSARTVTTHVERLLGKLGFSGRAAAAATALDQGLVRLPFPGGAARFEHLAVGRVAAAAEGREPPHGRRVSARTGTPGRAVWLSVGVAALLAAPSLYSETAYGAVTAINVIGITPAYAIPIFLRLRNRHRFQPGRWNLGRWGVLVGCVAVVWVAFVTVLFCLPQTSPVTVASFNYAPVALAAILLLATVWWQVAGRRGYTTPTTSPTDDRELAAFGDEIV